MATPAVALEAPGTSRGPSRARTIGLGAVFVSALVFWVLIAVPYLTFNEEFLGRYDLRRGWVVAHVAFGTVALLTGPIQLWLGFARRRMALHRTMGIAYMIAVGLGSLAAFRLAVLTDFGWVFGLALAMLGVVWLLTTGMAYVAIRRRQIAQHQEWMIRSYVTTFAFVLFRVSVGALQVAGVGTLEEQLTASAWICWSVPLVIAEVVLQSRRTLGASPSAARA